MLQRKRRRSQRVLITECADSQRRELAGRADKWLARGCGEWLSGSTDVTKGGTVRILKALCEVLFWESYVSLSPNKILLSKCITALSRWHRNRSLYAFAYRFPEYATLSLMAIYLVRRHISLESDEARDLRTLAAMLFGAPSERLPFRQLECLHTRYLLLGKRFPSKMMVRAAQYGCLSSIVEKTRFTLSDEYALTHTIFYLTDFGRRPWPGGLSSNIHLARAMNGLAELAATEMNYDILSEYVIASKMASLQQFQSAQYVDLIAKGFSATGFCRGPLDMRGYLMNEGLPEGSVEFFENYHTTLLARSALLTSMLPSPQGKLYTQAGHCNGRASSAVHAPIPRPLRRYPELVNTVKLQNIYLALSTASSVSVSDDEMMDILHDPMTINPLIEVFCLSRKFDYLLAHSSALTGSVMGLAEASAPETTASHPSLMRAASAARAVRERLFGKSDTCLLGEIVEARICALWPIFLSSASRAEPTTLRLCDQLTDLIIAWKLETQKVRIQQSPIPILATRLIRYLMRIRSHRHVCSLLSYMGTWYFRDIEDASVECRLFLRTATARTLAFGWIPSNTRLDAIAAALSDLAFTQMKFASSPYSLLPCAELDAALKESMMWEVPSINEKSLFKEGQFVNRVEHA